MKVDFKDILPIKRIENNVIVNSYGDIAACFAYQGKEMFSQGRDQLGELNEFFVGAYGYLDNSYVLHKQDITLETKYRAQVPENDTYMSRAYEKHYDNKKYFKTHSYLYIIKTKTLSVERGLSTPRKLSASSATTITGALTEFEIALKQLTAYFRQNGINLVPLEQDHVEKLLEGYFSFFEGGAVSDIEYDPELKISGKYGAILSLNNDNNQPDQVTPFLRNSEYSTEENVLYSDLLYSLGPGMKCNHILNQIVFFDGQTYWKNQLYKKHKDLTAYSKFSPGNPKLVEDHDRFMNDTIDASGVKKVCRYHMNVIFWGDNQHALEDLRGMVKGKFIDLGIVPHFANKYDIWSHYLSCVPGNCGTMPFEDTIISHSELATCFILKETVYDRSKGKPSTHGIRLTDRASNIPTFRDMWFEPYNSKKIDNRNALIIGKSGGGKSSTMIEVMRQFIETGFKVTGIDIGGSLELLVKEYNGNYIVYKQGMSLGINPFDMQKGYFDVDLLEYLATFISVLWKPGAPLEDEKRSVVEKIIVKFYEAEKVMQDSDKGPEERYLVKANKQAWFGDFYSWVLENKALIRSITKERQEFFDVDSFEIIMEQFVTGKFSNLFRVDETTKLLEATKPVTVFELNNIKDHPTLFPIFSMLIDYVSTNVLWKEVASPKVFLYDEAHKILEKPGMALGLRFQYKTYRKYDAGVWICIQQISDLDIGKENVADAILGNSDIKFIMRHALDGVDALRERLKLSPHQVALLMSIKNNFLDPKFPYTEHLNILGTDTKVLRTMISPEQRVIMMSEFKDKAELQGFVDREGDWYKGIEAFIEHKNWRKSL